MACEFDEEEGKAYIFLTQEYDVVNNTPTNFYRIGTADHLRESIAELQNGNPRLLKIICHTKTKVMLEKERKCHEKLKHLNIYRTWKGGTTWYKSDSVGMMKEKFKSAIEVGTEDCNIEAHR